jgi:hypothetical protein
LFGTPAQLFLNTSLVEGRVPPVFLRYSRMTLETRRRSAYDATYRLHAAITQEGIQTCCLSALAFANSAK